MWLRVCTQYCDLLAACLHLCNLLAACLHLLPLYSKSCPAAPAVNDHMVHLQWHTSCFVHISKHCTCFYCLDSGLVPAAADLLPAVYLLDEIAGLAGSGGEVAQGMADATIRRLGHRSPVVKLKVGTADKSHPLAQHGTHVMACITPQGVPC